MSTYPLSNTKMSHAVRRTVAGLLITGAALFGGSAIAHADPVSWFDQWVGHDRSLQLSHDGTGTLILGNGVRDTDQWAVTWKKNPSDSITITLASLLSRTGPGTGQQGEQFFATIQPNMAGVPTLGMHRVNPMGPNIIFCTMEELRTPGNDCG